MIPLHSVSVSRYQIAQTCLEKYNLQYIQGLRQKAAPSRSIQIGSLVHGFIESAWRSAIANDWFILYNIDKKEDVQYLQKLGWTDVNDILNKLAQEAIDRLEPSTLVEDNITLVNGEFVHNSEEDLERQTALINDALAITKHLFETHLNKYMPIVVTTDEGPVELVEYKFTVTKDGVDFNGIVDFVGYNTVTGTIDLIDWKVRSSFSNYDDMVLDPQLRTYSHVLRPIIEVDRVVQFQIRNRIPKSAEWVSPIYLPTNPEIEVMFFENIMTNTVTRHNDAQLASRPETRMNTGWHCRMCQFKNICQARIMGLDVDNLIETQYTVAEWKQDQDQETENDNG